MPPETAEEAPAAAAEETPSNRNSNNNNATSNNPFDAAENNNDATTNSNNQKNNENQHQNDDDDDDDDASVQSQQSAASIQLRQDFIRLTSQTNLFEPNDDDDVNVNPNQGVDLPVEEIGAYANYRHHNKSLAYAPTTPRICLVFVPLGCLIAHLIFLFGQTLPMWKLATTVEELDVWANATSKSAKWAYDALHLNHTFHYALDYNHTVNDFTYAEAIRDLWNSKTADDFNILPKIASGGLVFFSGIWPHLKLLLLQGCWWTSSGRYSQPRHRTKALGWLALLGKWSLADVLTVCVMVGVLNLEWIVVPNTIKNGVADHLHHLLDIASQIWTAEEVCTKAFHESAKDCHKPFSKCWGCIQGVNAAYYKPDLVEKYGKDIMEGIKVNGGGTMRLSVKGMEGIYFFCTAVIWSVLLSVVVEWYNYKHLQALRKQHRERRAQHGTAFGGLTQTTDEETPQVISDLDSTASEPLLAQESNDEDGPQFEPMELMEDSQSVFSHMIQRTANSEQYAWFQCHYILPLCTLGFVLMALFAPSMERHVGGGIPKLLKDVLGVNLDKTYSLETLKETTGQAGGWDWLLMYTFGLFIVVGPLIRAVLVVMVSMASKGNPESTHRIRSLLVWASNFLSAFCGWEVFLVAMIMVEMLMPSITKTILNNKACDVVIGESGATCVMVSYDRVTTTFACFILGFIMVSMLALHVSLEDEKERQLYEHGGGGVVQHLPTEVNAGYVPVQTNDDVEEEDEGRAADATRSPEEELNSLQLVDNAAGNREIAHQGNVTTMIQEETV